MRGKPQAFLGPDAQKSLSHQGVLEQPDGPILQVPLEIDEDVPAGNELHFSENRIRDQAVIRKDGALPQGLIEHGTAIAGGVVV